MAPTQTRLRRTIPGQVRALGMLPATDSTGSRSLNNQMHAEILRAIDHDGVHKG
jgi:hypothetical protein